MNHLLPTIVVGIAALAADLRAGDPSPRYVAVELGPPGAVSVANAINDLGQVAGYYYTPQNVQRTFLWLPRPAYGLDRGMHDLGALPGGWSRANDLNNLGQVVGASRTGERGQINQLIDHAFLWDPATHAMTDLGTLPFAYDGSEAAAINDTGQVAGHSIFNSVGNVVGFLWLPLPAFGLPAGMNELNGLTIVSDINEFGEVAGWFGTDIFGSDRALILLPHAAFGLSPGTHVIPGLENTTSRAFGINDAGAVVGMQAFNSGGFLQRAFLWGEGVTDLLPTPTGFNSALQINNHGRIVGSAAGPFTWLNGLGTPLCSLTLVASPCAIQFPNDINDDGQIVGYGQPNGRQRAVLLSPLMADFNADDLIDVNDHAILVRCLSGPRDVASIDCDPADIDRDGDADLGDLQVFHLAYSSGG